MNIRRQLCRQAGRSRAALALAALLMLPVGMSAQAWSWKTETLDKDGRYTKLGVDARGNLHISYLNEAEGIKYGFRPAGSSQWFTMVIDGWHGQSNMSTSIAVDLQGNPHICYTDSQMKYAHWDGQNWHIEQIAPGSGLIAYSCSVVVAPDGVPQLIWYQVDYGEQTNYLHLRHAIRQDGLWLARTVDFGGETGKWNLMVLDADARPHISYSEYHKGLKYARWDGKNWTVTMVDARGRGGSTYRGMGNALALDKNGNPLISYFDIEERTLKFARWQGNRWLIESLDRLSPAVGVGWVAWRSSLVVDQRGFPHIVYGDFGALKHAYWDSKQWHIQVIDKGGAGQYRYSSLAIGSEDTLYVSYQDAADGSLKIATGRLTPDVQTAASEKKKEN